jgi:hypothetical protein
LYNVHHGVAGESCVACAAEFAASERFGHDESPEAVQ